jgi:tetratricopeptide (TPR) repeat protein
MLASLFASLRGKKPAVSVAARLAAAMAAYDENELEHAEAEFVGIAEADPGNVQARLYAGLCAYRRGDATLALSRFVQGRVLDPRNHRGWTLEAQALAALGRSEEAIECCRAAIELAPNLTPAHQLWSALELPGEPYGALLPRLHELLRPATYLEIGVFEGRSFQFVRPETLAVGIDPEPALAFPVPARGRIIATTSDEFFATHDVLAEFGGQPVMLGFIDGMHWFEYALRDFINLERVASPDGTILIHDCYPINRVSAARERQTLFWSGDVWKTVLILKKYRPDLRVHTLALQPTGLGVVRALDPRSVVLSENYAAIVAEFMAVDYGVLDADKPAALNRFPNDWDRIRALFA